MEPNGIGDGMRIVVQVDGAEIFEWWDPTEASISHGLVNALRKYRDEVAAVLNYIDRVLCEPGMRRTQTVNLPGGVPIEVDPAAIYRRTAEGSISRSEQFADRLHDSVVERSQVRVVDNPELLTDGG